MSGPEHDLPPRVYDNVRRSPIILALALVSAPVYGWLSSIGELRGDLTAYLVAHGLLALAGGVAWLRVRRDSRRLGPALVAALLFRLLASMGEPALSDDVYRYVWDGRVQLAGVHPYLNAPADPVPELDGLRDASWQRINHPELPTIYPPLAQIFFLALAALGAGPIGFKLALGLLDFGVVLVLVWLLRRARLPADRAVLYAWHPLAVMETAGSGHIEPLGVLLVLLGTGWLIGRRRLLPPLALGGAIAAKLVPLVLVPGQLRRFRAREVWVLLAILALLWLPYAASGPAVGAGLLDYAERWEFNSFVYDGARLTLERFDVGPRLKDALGALQSRWSPSFVPWDFLYQNVWPDRVARALMGLAMLGWVGWLTFRRRLPAIEESYLVLAGLVVLSPTVHPWYVLWVLPFAAAFLASGWLWFSLLVPLSYLAGSAGVPWSIRCIEWVPALGLLAWSAWRSRRTARVPREGAPRAPGDSGPDPG